MAQKHIALLIGRSGQRAAALRLRFKVQVTFKRRAQSAALPQVAAGSLKEQVKEITVDADGQTRDLTESVLAPVSPSEQKQAEPGKENGKAEPGNYIFSFSD